MKKTKLATPLQRKDPPALTLEAREQQMIGLAMDLVEQRLRNGTATSQETTHFLKLGSTRAMVELEKVKNENALLTAKAESIKASQSSGELLEKAIAAFATYEPSDIDDYND